MSQLVCVLGTLTLLSLFGVGCLEDEKKPETKPPATPTALHCKSTNDCDKPLVCLAGECADPRLGTAPGNPVTPEKMKKEVEDIQKRAEERRQKALDL